MKPYDCIVIGLGGVGSAALFSAASQGWNVLGLEQFGLAHEFGSSHGHTRIIRTAYYEHPNYVPLAQQAFTKWLAFESQSRHELIKLTGLLQVGPADSDVICGTLESARRFDLSVEQLSQSQIMERFPAFKVNPQHVGLFESQAGYLRVERCVATMGKLAMDAGASVRTNTVVERWEIDSAGLVHVHAGGEEFVSKQLIICGGAWANSLLGDVCGELNVIRKQLNWFQIDRIDIKARNGFPVFLVDGDEGVFYGIPEIDYLGMKIAEHSGGQCVADPSKLDRNPNAEDLARVENFLDKNLVFTRRRMVHESVCMYTMTSDGHFVVDHHPKFDQVVFAAGLSGHGFKFAPVLGEHLVAMLKREADPLFDFLQIGNRFD